MGDDEHEGSGRPLAAAILMAMTAGFVDAHIFLHVTRVFVANMSGNLIHLGIDAGQGRWRVAARAGLAIASFVGGVVIATRAQGRSQARDGVAGSHRLLAGEAVILVVLAVTLFVIDPVPVSRPGPAELLVVVLGAGAMGVQAAAIGRVGAVAVTTTYETGSLVRIGRSLLPAVGEVPETAEVANPRRRTVVVVAVVVASYVVGAGGSTAAGGSPALMLLPAAAVALTAWLVRPASAVTTS